MKKRRFLKATAYFLLLLSVPEQSFSAQISPAYSSLPFSIHREVTLFEPPHEFSLPPQLGSVSEAWGKSPKIVLIQDPHSQLEAQKNIQAMLDYWNSKHLFSNLLIEGGFGKLDPDQLRFFKQESFNQEVAKVLLKEGEIGGPELFLLALAEKTTTLPAFGLESPNLYVQNIKAFQQVVSNQEVSEAFLNVYHKSLKKFADQFASPPLKKFIQRWWLYKEEKIEMISYLEEIKRGAKKALGLELDSPRSQLDWPMITRYFEIKRRDEKLDPAKALKELENLIGWSKENQIPSELIDYLGQRLKALKEGSVKEKTQDLLVQDVSPRNFWEAFMTVALSKGIELSAYQSLWDEEGSHILKDEIQIEKLESEIETLEEKMFSSHAQTEKEKQLVEALLFEERLRKFFKLQLSRSEWDELDLQIKAAGDSPLKSMLEGLAALSVENLWSKESEDIFQGAARFYQLAKLRDEVMAQHAIQHLSTQSGQVSIMIAGGFHTWGITEALKKKQIPYVVISPAMSQLQSDEKYVASIMGNPAESERAALPDKVRFPSFLNPVFAWESSGLAMKRRRDLIHEELDAGLERGATLRLPFSQNKIFTPRSEVRAEVVEMDAPFTKRERDLLDRWVHKDRLREEKLNGAMANPPVPTLRTAYFARKIPTHKGKRASIRDLAREYFPRNLAQGLTSLFLLDGYWASLKSTSVGLLAKWLSEDKELQAQGIRPVIARGDDFRADKVKIENLPEDLKKEWESFKQKYNVLTQTITQRPKDKTEIKKQKKIVKREYQKLKILFLNQGIRVPDPVTGEAGLELEEKYAVSFNHDPGLHGFDRFIRAVKDKEFRETDPYSRYSPITDSASRGHYRFELGADGVVRLLFAWDYSIWAEVHEDQSGNAILVFKRKGQKKPVTEFKLKKETEFFKRGVALDPQVVKGEEGNKTYRFYFGQNRSHEEQSSIDVEVPKSRKELIVHYGYLEDGIRHDEIEPVRYPANSYQKDSQGKEVEVRHTVPPLVLIRYSFDPHHLILADSHLFLLMKNFLEEKDSYDEHILLTGSYLVRRNRALRRAEIEEAGRVEALDQVAGQRELTHLFYEDRRVRPNEQLANIILTTHSLAETLFRLWHYDRLGDLNYRQKITRQTGITDKELRELNQKLDELLKQKVLNKIKKAGKLLDVFVAVESNGREVWAATVGDLLVKFSPPIGKDEKYELDPMLIQFFHEKVKPVAGNDFVPSVVLDLSGLGEVKFEKEGRILKGQLGEVLLQPKGLSLAEFLQFIDHVIENAERVGDQKKVDQYTKLAKDLIEQSILIVGQLAANGLLIRDPARNFSSFRVISFHANVMAMPSSLSNLTEDPRLWNRDAYRDVLKENDPAYQIPRRFHEIYKRALRDYLPRDETFESLFGQQYDSNRKLPVAKVEDWEIVRDLIEETTAFAGVHQLDRLFEEFRFKMETPFWKKKTAWKKLIAWVYFVKERVSYPGSEFYEALSELYYDGLLSFIREEARLKLKQTPEEDREQIEGILNHKNYVLDQVINLSDDGFRRNRKKTSSEKTLFAHFIKKTRDFLRQEAPHLNSHALRSEIRSPNNRYVGISFRDQKDMQAQLEHLLSVLSQFKAGLLEAKDGVYKDYPSFTQGREVPSDIVEDLRNKHEVPLERLREWVQPMSLIEFLHIILIGASDEEKSLFVDNPRGHSKGAVPILHDFQKEIELFNPKQLVHFKDAIRAINDEIKVILLTIKEIQISINQESDSSANGKLEEMRSIKFGLHNVRISLGKIQKSLELEQLIYEQLAKKYGFTFPEGLLEEGENQRMREDVLYWEWKLTPKQGDLLKSIPLASLIARKNVLQKLFFETQTDPHLYFNVLEHPEALQLPLLLDDIERLRMAAKEEGFETVLKGELAKRQILFSDIPWTLRLEDPYGYRLWTNIDQQLQRADQEAGETAVSYGENIALMNQFRGFYFNSENQIPAPSNALKRQVILNEKTSVGFLVPFPFRVAETGKNGRAILFLNEKFWKSANGSRRAFWLRAGTEGNKKIITAHLSPDGQPVGRARWDSEKNQFVDFEGPIAGGHESADVKRLKAWIVQPYDREGVVGEWDVYHSKVSLFRRPDSSHITIQSPSLDSEAVVTIRGVPNLRDKRIYLLRKGVDPKDLSEPIEERYFESLAEVILPAEKFVRALKSDWNLDVPDGMGLRINHKGVLHLPKTLKETERSRITIKKPQPGKERIFVIFEAVSNRERDIRKVVRFYGNSSDPFNRPSELWWEGYFDEGKKELIKTGPPKGEEGRLENRIRHSLQLDAWRLEHFARPDDLALSVSELEHTRSEMRRFEINEVGVFVVADRLTGKVLATDEPFSGNLLDQLVPPDFADQGARITTQDENDFSDRLSSTIKRGVSIVLPAQLLSSQMISKETREAFVRAFVSAAEQAPEASIPTIYLTGQGAKELKTSFYKLDHLDPVSRHQVSRLFKIQFQSPEKTGAELYRQGKPVAVGSEDEKVRSEQNIALAIFRTDIQGFLKLSSHDQWKYLTRLTQLLLAAAALDPKDVARLLQDLGISSSFNREIPFLSSEVLLQDKVAEILLQAQLSKSA